MYFILMFKNSDQDFPSSVTESCASAVASALTGKTGNQVTVYLALGDLFIEWIDENVFMTGPATNVFSGEIEI